ncbi:RraA family protein [Paenibacillus hamazuiensis]|uniref:RraA family protein n=1 Tax=Paenibacillus hamazuiensis TaxID=2936508 RepID=UPI00200F215E|nr:RraA family protein [Paenibacillus hamazuiensis]
MSDIVKQFEAIPTTCISDTMQGLNNMDSSIKPLKEEYRVAGRAFTVKMPVGDNLTVLKAIREAKPGDVLVIDSKGETYRTVAGDFIIGLAQTLGIAGIVADGVIRDILATKALNYPVFCKGATVASSNKSGWGEVNVPISCGGVSVRPGDIVVGDADGVVVVPQEKEQQILQQSLAKLAKDREREASVSGNPEAIRKYLDEMIGSK